MSAREARADGRKPSPGGHDAGGRVDARTSGAAAVRAGASPNSTTPVLLVPSLINRWYVLDLGPGKSSLIEWLVAQGHDVYCIDWGTPGDEDRYLTWDDIARSLPRPRGPHRRALRPRGKAHVLGYCLGGTLAAIYVAAFPGARRVAARARRADRLRATAASCRPWTRTPTFDVARVVEAFGNVPWQLMQASFNMLRPTLRAREDASRMLDRAWDDEFLDGFLATETWGNDNVSFPGACYARYIEELYRDDKLDPRRVHAVAAARATSTAITCPMLAIAFEHDNIVPLRERGAAGRSRGEHRQAARRPARRSRRRGRVAQGRRRLWPRDVASSGRSATRT